MRARPITRRPAYNARVPETHLFMTCAGMSMGGGDFAKINSIRAYIRKCLATQGVDDVPYDDVDLLVYFSHAMSLKWRHRRMFCNPVDMSDSDTFIFFTMNDGARRLPEWTAPMTADDRDLVSRVVDHYLAVGRDAVLKEAKLCFFMLSVASRLNPDG